MLLHKNLYEVAEPNSHGLETDDGMNYNWQNSDYVQVFSRFNEC